MTTPQIGDVLGGHRIESVLGEGGFGTVFGARDANGMLVAVKVLKPDDGDTYSSNLRRRFDREVALVSQLRCEHTVQLLGYGETPSGLLFMVFEYLDGEDLVDVLRRTPRLAPDTVTHILVQLLASLSEAHRAGLLHRDIKPENVRVCARADDPWHVKLLDFGIARPLDRSTPKLTATGELIGTPRYMSPEQLTEKKLSPASDIYSLGALGFEMLLGSEALPGHGWGDQFERLRTGHVFSAEAALGAEKLGHILQRMTARDVSDRYASAEAVLAALGEHPDVDQPAPDDRVINPVAVGVVVAVVVVAGILAVMMGDEPEVAPPVKPVSVVLPVEPKPPPTVHPPDAGRTDAVLAPELEPPPIAAVCTAPRRRGLTTMRDLSGLNSESWDAYVPREWSGTKPLPLVLLLHEKGDDPKRWLRVSGFPELAEQHQFIVIAPWDPVPLWKQPWEGKSNLPKVRGIVQATAEMLCVDADRVFAVGHGQAAFLIARLGCEDWVRAVATNGSRYTGEHRCNDHESHAPRLLISPRDSARLPEKGRNCRQHKKQSVAHTLHVWRRRYKCGEDGETTFEHANGTCSRWQGCAIRLESCVVEGGDPWPGMTAPFDCKSRAPDFPVAERIWTFFDEVAPRTTENSTQGNTNGN